MWGVRLPRHLGSCSRLPTGSASHLSHLSPGAAVVSEIAAGRIALFTPRTCARGICLCCSRPFGRQSGLSGPTAGPSHAFAWHPALCSSDFPLPYGSGHPAPPALPNPIVVRSQRLLNSPASGPVTYRLYHKRFAERKARAISSGGSFQILLLFARCMIWPARC